MDVTRKLVLIGLLLLGTLATGFWRGNAGNLALSGLLHKLLGLAWVTYTAIEIFHLARRVEPRAAFFAAIAVLGLSMATLIATGSLLTVPKFENNVWPLVLHRIVSAIAAIAMASTARLFIVNRP